MTIIIAAISRVSAIEVSVILRAHGTSATPTLITYAKEFNIPGLLTSVLATQFSHWSLAVRGHILNPFSKFFYSTTAHIATDVWFTTEHLAEIKELMSTKRVVFYGSAPVIILHLRALFLRSNTVHPVIFVSKASARPTKNRNLKRLQRIENVLTITLDIRDVRIFPYPKTTINAGTKMLSKLSINLFMNFLRTLVNVNGQRCILRCCHKC